MDISYFLIYVEIIYILLSDYAQILTHLTSKVSQILPLTAKSNHHTVQL